MPTLEANAVRDWIAVGKLVGHLSGVYSSFFYGPAHRSSGFFFSDAGICHFWDTFGIPTSDESVSIAALREPFLARTRLLEQRRSTLKSKERDFDDE